MDDGFETTQLQGQDYAFAPFVGVDRLFGHFAAGLEFAYNLGRYIQRVNNGIEETRKRVSINDPEITNLLG